MADSRSRLRSILDMLATVAVIAAAAAVVFSVFFRAPAAGAAGSPRPEPPVPTETQSLSGTASIGDPAARVVLIEYADFECGVCRLFDDNVLPKLKEQFIDSGKVRFLFRHFPLNNHRFAQTAAHAVECAGQQGRFVEMKDDLFSNPNALQPEHIVSRAGSLVPDTKAFQSCLAGALPEQVVTDTESAKTLSLIGTPTFFFGRSDDGQGATVTDRISGLRPFEEFERILNKLLSDAPTS